MSFLSLGGYPKHWFKNVPNEEFICAICQDVLNDPQSCKNGDSFCKSCILNSIKTSRQCPTCKSLLNETMLCASIYHGNLIQDMNCSWTGPLHMLTLHSEQCYYEPMLCPLYVNGSCTVEDCDGNVIRKDFSDHIFVSMKASILQICSPTKQNSFVHTTIETTRREKEIQSHRLMRLKERAPPGVVTRQLAGQSTLFSGTLPDYNRKHMGLLVFSDNSLYSGELLSYVSHGKGLRKYINGAWFNGDWRDGHWHGHGTYRSSTGAITVGLFRNGRSHGRGRWTSADCRTTYEGDFFDGKFHGSGVLTTAGGTIYEGEFEKGRYHGKGTETAPDGSGYSGDWAEGNMEGKGTYTWSTEPLTQDTGSFIGGKLHGKGIRYFGDGRVFTGRFENDKLHGAGEMKYVDGRTETGTWQYGIKLPEYYN